MNLAERAATIAAEARLNPQQERQLHATIDREQSRDWYVVTKPNAEPIKVHFNPPQTIGEVRSIWYPGCGVLPA